MSNSDLYKSFIKTVRSYVGLNSPKTKKKIKKNNLVVNQPKLQKGKKSKKKNNNKSDLVIMIQQAIIKNKLKKNQKQRAIKAIAIRDFTELEKILREYTKTINY